MSVEYLFQAVLVMASVGLAFFCLILSRRLRRLNDLETGLGGAIAVMAAEVDRLEVAMRAARDDATKGRRGTDPKHHGGPERARAVGFAAEDRSRGCEPGNDGRCDAAFAQTSGKCACVGPGFPF